MSVAFHKPKTYRLPEGCCICRAKSSSSRFTESEKYSMYFQRCFKLKEPREGKICNACVLLVKRYKKLPAGEERDWRHKVDSRMTPGPRRTAARRRRAANNGKAVNDAPHPGPGDVPRPGPDDAGHPRPDDVAHPGPDDAARPGPDDGARPRPDVGGSNGNNGTVPTAVASSSKCNGKRNRQDEEELDVSDEGEDSDEDFSDDDEDMETDESRMMDMPSTSKGISSFSKRHLSLLPPKVTHCEAIAMERRAMSRRVVEGSSRRVHSVPKRRVPTVQVAVAVAAAAEEEVPPRVNPPPVNPPPVNPPIDLSQWLQVDLCCCTAWRKDWTEFVVDRRSPKPVCPVPSTHQCNYKYLLEVHGELEWERNNPTAPKKKRRIERIVIVDEHTDLRRELGDALAAVLEAAAPPPSDDDDGNAAAEAVPMANGDDNAGNNAAADAAEVAEVAEPEAVPVPVPMANEGAAFNDNSSDSGYDESSNLSMTTPESTGTNISIS